MNGGGKRAREPQPAGDQDEAAGDEEEEETKRTGRLSADHMQALYTQRSTIALDRQLTKEDFCKHEKAWAASLIPGQHLNIRHQHMKFKNGFKMLLWCNSCEKCKEKAGWKGYSTFDTSERQITRMHTPSDSHGDFKATKNWNPLTATAENALKAFVEQTPHFTTQDLVKIVEKHMPDSRPSDAWLLTWGRNHKVHKGSTSSRLTELKWVEADWRQIERTFGRTRDIAEVVNELKVAASLYEPTQTIVVFCNPKLLSETLHSLTNKLYIKLCGDGTFRLTEGEWVLMTVGILSKHYARSEGVNAFCTSFHPLIFGLANKESEITYEVLFQALCDCSIRFAQIDLRPCVRQFHADMHLGEDLALKTVFTNACRVADWAHVIGACTRPKTQPASKSDRINAFRSGAWATMKKRLTLAGQKLLPLIQRAFHCLRSVPTALLFHTISEILLQILLSQEPPEEKAAKALESYYFVSLTPAEAQSHFDILNWPGNPNRFLIADWWAGLQRLQPGSASGTQAQESWHRHKLKKYLGLKQGVKAFVENLQAFTMSRLADLQSQGSSLPDMPCEPFPDKTVMFDSKVLTREGRTSSDQFFRTRAWDRCEEAADGTVFYCFPRTLATYNHDSKEWELTPDSSVRRPSLGFAGAFVALLRANSEPAVLRALQSLGLQNPFLDLESLLKLLDSYVLVAIGPSGAEYWRRQSAEGEENPHTQGFCAFCHEFCLHGSCEHFHAANVDLKQISLQEPTFPQRQKAIPIFQQSPVEVVLPAESRSDRAMSPASRPSKHSMGRHRANAALTDFLRASGWALWDSVLQQERFTIDQLAMLAFCDLRVALPSVPAGILLRMQAAAREWQQSVSASGRKFEPICNSFH